MREFPAKSVISGIALRKISVGFLPVFSVEAEILLTSEDEAGDVRVVAETNMQRAGGTLSQEVYDTILTLRNLLETEVHTKFSAKEDEEDADTTLPEPSDFDVKE